MQPRITQSNCSAAFSGSGFAPIFGGAGRYSGITGSLKVTLSTIAILPRVRSGAHKGRCDANATPLAEAFSITATGRVSF